MSNGFLVSTLDEAVSAVAAAAVQWAAFFVYAFTLEDSRKASSEFAPS